jgi:hypothetical protein
MPRLLLFFRLGKIFIFSANIRNLLLPIQFEEDTTFFQNHKPKTDCPEYRRKFSLCYVPGSQESCKGLFHESYQGSKSRELLPDLTIYQLLDAKIFGELIAHQSYQ